MLRLRLNFWHGEFLQKMFVDLEIPRSQEIGIRSMLPGGLGPLLMAPTVLVIALVASVQLELGIVTSSFCH